MDAEPDSNYDSGFLARHAWPLAVVALAVVVANLAAVVHLVSTDPLQLYGAVARSSGAVLPGFPAIDPNSGFINQAVGHLVANDWLHGHVPWWNPYEGVGMPLVAEGQNGALFPLVVLLEWSHGFLVLHLVLEIVAGWATYFLVRRLGVGPVTATACGIAYALCGTFAWFAGNPGPALPFLPLALLGVEDALRTGEAGRARGWRLLALAVALSAVAGFPETAFIDGILVVLWALARLVPLQRAVRRVVAAKIATGLAVGVALTAPLAIAFAVYVPHALIGGHSGGFSKVSLAPAGLSQLLLPYGFGPIFAFHSSGAPDVISTQWDNVGGYLGVVLVFTGLLGILGARRSALRWVLAAWVLLCLLRSYGFAPVVDVMGALPGLHQVAFYRYDNPAWTMAVIVLAGLGIDDVVHGRLRRWQVALALAAAGGCAAWAGAEAWHVMGQAAGATHPRRYVAASVAGAAVLLVVCGAAALIGTGPTAGTTRSDVRRRLGLVAGVVMSCAMGLEAAALLGVTQLSAPTSVEPTTGAASWLARHVGTSRFVTLGPVQPNYGSYFGAAEVSTNDLPFPKAWNSYIATRLDPNAPELSFTGVSRIDPAQPSPAEALSARLPAYEAVGVRYVVEPAFGTDVQGRPFPPAGSPTWPRGPRRVYLDSYAAVWELPSPAPLWSARADGGGRCAVTGQGWDAAVVSCPGPGTLVRRMLALPGWTAEASGRAVDVRATGPDALFEQVRVPAGTSRITFSYFPPHERPAIALAGAALVLLVVPLPFTLGRRRPTAGERRPG